MVDDANATKVTILRYGEIFLKGKNQAFFFRRLINNVRAFCKHGGIAYESIRRISGRIVIAGAHVPEAADVCGIVSASPAWQIKAVHNLEEIKDLLLQIAKDAGIEAHATLRVKTKRANKSYPHTSQQVSAIVAEMFINHFGKRVDLTHGSFELGIDIIDEHFYLHTMSVTGVGGLPVDHTHKVVALLSGGIDSPVASFLMNKRGCHNVLVHFSSRPHTPKQSEEKIKKIAEQLTRFQFRTRLYIVQIADIQKHLSTHVHGSLLVVFYRRMMLRIAEMIKTKEHALALVTGDNLGQVASQTMHNMIAIEDAVAAPVLRPLLTYDKTETTQLARRIGTYDLSIIPFDDCCTLFVPKHPETKADVEKIRKIEEGIFDEKLKNMLKDAAESAEVVEIE